MDNDLAIEAYNEVLDFVCDNYSGVDAWDRISFVEMWREGDWTGIREDFPEFSLDTEAQKYLIKASGGYNNV